MDSTGWQAEVKRFVAKYFAAFSAGDANAVWEMQTDALKRVADHATIGAALQATQRLASGAGVRLNNVQLSEDTPGHVEVRGTLEWFNQASGLVARAEDVVWLIILEDGEWKWAGVDRAKDMSRARYHPPAWTQGTEHSIPTGRRSLSDTNVVEPLSSGARRAEAEELVKRLVTALSQRDAGAMWEGLSREGRAALDRNLLTEIMQTGMFTSGRTIALNRLDLFELTLDRIEARVALDWFEQSSDLVSETTEEIWVLVQEGDRWRLWAGPEGLPKT